MGLPAMRVCRPPVSNSRKYGYTPISRASRMRPSSACALSSIQLIFESAKRASLPLGAPLRKGSAAQPAAPPSRPFRRNLRNGDVDLREVHDAGGIDPRRVIVVV